MHVRHEGQKPDQETIIWLEQKRKANPTHQKKVAGLDPQGTRIQSDRDQRQQQNKSKQAVFVSYLGPGRIGHFIGKSGQREVPEEAAGALAEPRV